MYGFVDRAMLHNRSLKNIYYQTLHTFVTEKFPLSFAAVHEQDQMMSGAGHQQSQRLKAVYLLKCVR